MKYCFDEPAQRRNTNSLKWDVAENELPMWVADMDFKAAPAVIRALENKLEQGIFGYQIVPDEWYNAIIGWGKSRHNIEIKREWLSFCTGVIPAISSAVKRVTNHGDNVVLQTPVYDIFFHSVENAGRHVLENRLGYDGEKYFFDFEDLEKKLADPLTTMMILCNPLNPAGKVPTADELARIGALCKKYGVTVLSDEIHCDLTAPDCAYTPFAAASEECRQISINCVAASKAFNLAGLQSAAVFVADENLRNKVFRGLNSDEVAEPNAFAVDATVAALTEGGDWLDGLREYLFKNRAFAEKFLKENLPQTKLVKAEATYLLWIDCTAVTADAESLCGFIRERTGLYITAGNQYRGNGKTFVRINAACPMQTLKDGLNRFAKGVNEYLKMEKK